MKDPRVLALRRRIKAVSDEKLTDPNATGGTVEF